MSITTRTSGQELESMASSMFAKLFQAYMECSEPCQSVIRDMAEIANDEEADPQDREMAISTIADALFPWRTDGKLGIDLEAAERLDARSSPKARSIVAEMDREEAHFADRVKSLLDERGMTQAELAKACDMGQPAISMMLSRKGRPQRRTVEKVARALSVDVSDLWPTTLPSPELA